MAEAFIVDAVRTPIGKKRGFLSGMRGDELAAIPLKALVARNHLDAAEIEDVIMGCVTQVGEQGLNIARNALLIAGFPVEVTGTSVNRMCGSSQQAVNFAAQAVMSGTNDLVVGAGVESMSRVSMGSDMIYQNEMIPPSPLLTHRFAIVPQGISAEMVAKKWGLTRQELDLFSYQSHMKAAAAADGGRFKEEIIPVTMEVEGTNKTLDADEGIRRDTSLEKLAALAPSFQAEGVITAGSSSQISDGAAAVLVASEKKAKDLGLTPLARFVAMATAGVDPTIMLTGPIPATRKVLAKAGLSIADMDLIEINEAFASVVLAWLKEIEAPIERVNVNGGAIALGHPLGASGARLITTAVHELLKRNGRYALITMCIGFGQATATIIERV